MLGVDLLKIFVTLGTSKQDFSRLIKELDVYIGKNKCTDIVVQSNKCIYVPKNFKIINELSKKDYLNNLKNSDLIITHGGVGSIMDALKFEKKVIAFPRLAEFNEAVNNHQEQIVNLFAEKGYILTGEISNLKQIINKESNFEPKSISLNNKKFNDILFSKL